MYDPATKNQNGLLKCYRFCHPYFMEIITNVTLFKIIKLVI